eukprot:m.35528 g.35528  ORF g.35528 m.35528 type:complete len:506 (+) comp9900_c0_seq1:50-1567(+)
MSHAFDGISLPGMTEQSNEADRLMGTTETLGVAYTQEVTGAGSVTTVGGVGASETKGLTDTHSAAHLAEDANNTRSNTSAMGWLGSEVVSVVIMGLAFLCMMASFQTSSFFQSSILKAQGFNNLGLVSLGLVYAFFSLSNFVAPFIISKIGARACMMVGALGYIAMLASLIRVNKVVFLAASCLNGVGAALVWTGQGTAITCCSNEKTRGRNSGIFWAILQLSLVVGSSLSLVIIPKNASDVTQETARKLYIGLASMCTLGMLILLLLRLKKPPHDARGPATFFGLVKKTITLLKERKIRLVCILIFFTGLHISFWQGQYPLILSGKEPRVVLPDAFKAHTVAYLMMCICGAEVLGSLIFGKLSDRVGRWPVVLIGGLLATTAYLLIYLNIIRQLWIPTPTLAYIYGVILGLADSVYNTQTFAVLGDLYPDRVSDAFALNFFFKALASAVAFGYTPYGPIWVQLVVLGTFLATGTAAFVSVSRYRANLPTMHVQAETVTSLLSDA